MLSWLIAFSALSAIIAVNWYFFGKPKAAGQATVDASGVQEVTITVEGGYSPSVSRVSSGSPVRLVFHRKEKSPCSDEVVIGKAGIRRFLKPFATTVIEFTPSAPGTYEFTCGMNMLRGRVEVEG